MVDGRWPKRGRWWLATSVACHRLRGLNHIIEKKYCRSKIFCSHYLFLKVLAITLSGDRPQKWPATKGLFWPATKRFLRPTANDQRPSQHRLWPATVTLTNLHTLLNLFQRTILPAQNHDIGHIYKQPVIYNSRNSIDPVIQLF